MNAYSIGVDLGGTNLRAAAIDSEGNLLERVAVPGGAGMAAATRLSTTSSAAIHGVRGR